MPNYKYVCTNEECSHYQEIFKSSSLYKEIEHCEVCNSILKRDPKDLVCGYTNDKDFCGKSKPIHKSSD